MIDIKKFTEALGKEDSYLAEMFNTNLLLSYQVSLKAVAEQQNFGIDIDKEKVVWTVNLINGAIVKVERHEVKNYNHLAAFTSFERALAAKRLCRVIGDVIYGKQENTQYNSEDSK